jgi:hypothetical protein
MPYQHERILSGIMGKGEIVGVGEKWQRRFAVLTEQKLAFAAFQGLGVSYGESSIPENYTISIGITRAKFDEFDVEKTGLLKVDAAQKCLDDLNKTHVVLQGSILENRARAENPGTELEIAHAVVS